MDSQDITVLILGFSILAGIGIAVLEPADIQDAAEFAREFSTSTPDNSSSPKYTESTHEHALFYVVVNGTEIDFSSRKYQLNSRHVHLENNRSDIVHKHAEGVTWSKFLDTINSSVNATNSTVCFSSFNNSYCGEGMFVLNKRKNPSLGKEIQQGDRFYVVIGQDYRDTLREYLKKQLPRNYQPQRSRGRRV